MNAKRLVVSFGGNGNASAIEKSAQMDQAEMWLVIVGSCLMRLGRDWLILACGKKTRIINMKTYTTYESLPKNTIYLGSENGDGSMFEELDTLIYEALNPVVYKDEDGIRHYFDIEQ